MVIATWLDKDDNLIILDDDECEPLTADAHTVYVVEDLFSDILNAIEHGIEDF